MKQRLTVALLGLIAMIACDLINPKGTNALECRASTRRTVRASWYGAQHHGKPTKSGAIFNMFAFTAASNRIPLGSWVSIYNPKTKKVAVAKINDTGAFEKYGRQLDVSWAIAHFLGFEASGTAPLQVCVLQVNRSRTAR